MKLFMTVAPLAEALLQGKIDDARTLAEAIHLHGVDGIEIHLSVSSKVRLADLLSDRLRGRVSFHSNHREFNLASANHYIRDASILQLSDEIALADEHGATHLTFHPGISSSRQPRQEAMETFWKSLQLVLQNAEPFQTALCVENMDNKPQKLCRTMQEVGATLERFPQLGLTCDIAHLALNNIDHGAFLDRFAHRIRHIHASGVVSGKSHGKTSLKESEVDIVSVLQRFAHGDIAVVIENNASEILEESVAFLTSCSRH